MEFTRDKTRLVALLVLIDLFVTSQNCTMYYTIIHVFPSEYYALVLTK